MDEPRRAHTFNEVRYCLMVTPCDACGKGPWAMDAGRQPDRPGQVAEVLAHCRHCGRARTFRFLCEYVAGTRGPDAERINPGRSASTLIDLGQWLSLFYMLVESGASSTSKPDTRRAGYRAALCLAEALKFYGDDELPPESAFFSETSAAAFRGHPENFARQRLRDMQAKLPDLSVMARHVALDERCRGRAWWRFWRR